MAQPLKPCNQKAALDSRRRMGAFSYAFERRQQVGRNIKDA